MISLSSSLEARFPDAVPPTEIVRICTSRCFYRVAISRNLIRIFGPGVDTSVEPEDNETLFNLNMTACARASLAIILFEEGELE